MLLPEKREVICPHCGHHQQSRAKGMTRCGECDKTFNVRKQAPVKEAPVKKEREPLGDVKKVPESTAPIIQIKHVPEPRRTEQPPPTKEGEKETPEEEKTDEQAAAGGEMIPPAGLYSIFVQLPNDFAILIYPDLEGELRLTPAEEAAMTQWAQMLYDYCIRHGITIPDYLELIPIVLIPLGFHAKRIKAIVAKVRAERAANKPPPMLEPEPGVSISTSADNTTAKSRVDMDELTRRMGNRPANRPIVPPAPASAGAAT